MNTVEHIAAKTATDREVSDDTVRANCHEYGIVSKAKAAQHTNCGLCQAVLVDFFISNPRASEAEAENAVRDAWENCPDCVAEYKAWSEATERSADEESGFDALCEAYDAEVDELASLGEAGQHAIAGHDAKWQNGGKI